ncbi:MAG TPA: hypothetical protein VF977_11860, partial [Candidatus Binatia bacterium]
MAPPVAPAWIFSGCQRLHRIRAAAGLKNCHVDVRPQAGAFERDAQESVSLRTILRHANDLSPKFFEFVNSHLGRVR